MILRAWSAARRFFPEALMLAPIDVVLDSGVRLRIDSRLSLDMFVELFVAQPYLQALDEAGKIEFAVDLGANRGFFLLFVHHHLRRRGQIEPPEFVCVEAAPRNFKALKRHIAMNGFEHNVVAVEGAVCGKRSGSVEFYYTPRFHGMAGIVEKRGWFTRRVPAVNLSYWVSNRRIDVLKVDIEGAEESFLTEYADILARTRVLVAEFHLKEVDYSRCRVILERSGLDFVQRTFEFQDVLCVEVYRRSGAPA